MRRKCNDNLKFVLHKFENYVLPSRFSKFFR